MEKGKSKMDSNIKGLIKTVQATHGKQAIALCGSANTGKTHALKALADWFRNQDASLAAMKAMGTGLDELWAFNWEGVRIGIATGGDNQAMITNAFEFFAANGCEIVFCATRYRADSQSWTEFEKECAAKGFTTHWTSAMEIPPECCPDVNRARAIKLATAL